MIPQRHTHAVGLSTAWLCTQSTSSAEHVGPQVCLTWHWGICVQGMMNVPEEEDVRAAFLRHEGIEDAEVCALVPLQSAACL